MAHLEAGEGTCAQLLLNSVIFRVWCVDYRALFLVFCSVKHDYSVGRKEIVGEHLRAIKGKAVAQ
jgi:hypothetical protein